MKSLPIREQANEPAIGARLRHARQARQMTVEELAEAAGVSKGFVSRLERDLTLPSIPTLLGLCRVLRIDASEVFRPAAVDVVRAEAGSHVDMGGTGIEERLLTPVHERRLQLIRSVIAPGGCGEDVPYTVDCAVEAVHVVSGCMVLHVDGVDHELTAGDTVTLPGDAPHTWRNPGSAAAVVLWALAG